MADKQLVFNTPGGRYIGGSLTEKQTTDHLGRPIPEDKQRYSIGVAFPKANPADTTAPINILLGQIYNHGLACFSSLPGGQAAYAQAQRWLDPNASFSWKIKDGDLPNAKGEFNEYSKGCWVFWFSSSFPVKAAHFENGVTNEIPPANIKRGYYVDVYGNCSPNDNTDNTAGMYMNPSVIRLIGYGPEIVGGVNVTQAFAAAPAPVLPAGASTMPVAGAPIPQQVAQPAYTPPAAQQPPVASVPAQLPGFTPAPAPTPAPIGNGLPATGYPTNVTPHTAFVPGAPQQQAQPAYAPPVGLPGQ